MRKLLERVFCKRELDALDHEVPTWGQLNPQRTSCCRLGVPSCMVTCLKKIKSLKKVSPPVKMEQNNSAPQITPQISIEVSKEESVADEEEVEKI